MFYRKTSATAYLIADSLAKFSQTPRWKSYFSDDMAQLNKAFACHVRDTPAKHLISYLPLPLSIFLMDKFFIPGMTHHYLFRKLWIESQLTKALATGARQVVVLGGGLDTLAIRMAKQHAAVQFFEIDLPFTQRTKLQVLDKIKYDIPLNCIFKAADLAKATLETVLCGDKAFKRDAPTLVIIEGVLMYLSETEVKALFAGLHHLIQAPLTIVFGAMAIPDQAGNWRVRLTSAILGNAHETTKWYCQSAVMPPFMAELGYEMLEWIPYKQLQHLYRSANEIQNVPEEDENYYIVTKQ